MRASRTHARAATGRLGSLQAPCRGGTAQFRGLGKMVLGQMLERRLGRQGTWGRSFARYVCARGKTGVRGPGSAAVNRHGVPRVGPRQAPPLPLPPFSTLKPLFVNAYSSIKYLHPTSPLFNCVLPNLPSIKKGFQPIGLSRSKAAKSSERAEP